MWFVIPFPRCEISHLQSGYKEMPHNLRRCLALVIHWVWLKLFYKRGFAEIWSDHRAAGICIQGASLLSRSNEFNKSFRSPHPFRSLELHFQTILQGPCMPDSMYHSPVAVSLKNTIWGWEFYSGPCTIQQCEELFHQWLQEMGCICLEICLYL